MSTLPRSSRSARAARARPSATPAHATAARTRVRPAPSRALPPSPTPRLATTPTRSRLAARLIRGPWLHLSRSPSRSSRAFPRSSVRARAHPLTAHPFPTTRAARARAATASAPTARVRRLRVSASRTRAASSRRAAPMPRSFPASQRLRRATADSSGSGSRFSRNRPGRIRPIRRPPARSSSGRSACRPPSWARDPKRRRYQTAPPRCPPHHGGVATRAVFLTRPRSDSRFPRHPGPRP